MIGGRAAVAGARGLSSLRLPAAVAARLAAWEVSSA